MEFEKSGLKNSQEYQFSFHNGQVLLGTGDIVVGTNIGYEVNSGDQKCISLAT